jgi:hypothetical protein
LASGHRISTAFNAQKQIGKIKVLDKYHNTPLAKEISTIPTLNYTLLYFVLIFLARVVVLVKNFSSSDFEKNNFGR